VFSSPVFTPDAAQDRVSNVRAARIHFQAVLTQLESLVRRYPTQWFNFVPLTPVVPAIPSRAAFSAEESRTPHPAQGGLDLDQQRLPADVGV
jgi:hypothetical protein